MRVKEVKKSYIVIGLGRFGSSIVRVLSNMNCDVLAIDINEESVQAISDYTNHCVIADSTKLAVLKELGCSQIDHAVVAIGNNLQSSILTVLNLKSLGVPRITVRADEERHKEIFSMLGANEVIIPEEASAISLANQILSDSVIDYYPLSGDYSMVKIIVGENFTPKSIIDLNVRVLFDVNIVGIIKNGVFAIPKPNDLISPGDILVVVGISENYKRFDLFLNEKSIVKPQVNKGPEKKTTSKNK